MSERPLPPILSTDFTPMDVQQVVEHLTIPGFLRQVGGRWSMQDIGRFGKEVGRAAEGLQLAFLTTIDGLLGILRVFPVPMLRRVYTVMSPQFKWPALEEPPKQLPPSPLQDVRTYERTERFLSEVEENAQSAEVRQAISDVRQYMADRAAALAPPADATPQ